MKINFRFYASIALLAVVLNMVPLAAMAQSGSALTESEQRKLNLLYKMNIIDSDKFLGENVSRGEFAQWIANLLGYKDSTFPVEKFEDVPATHKYAGFVAFAYTIGAMNGISDNTFGINTEISQQDAMVALVRALGYGEKAEYEGGYPEGYNKIAYSIKLFSGIVTDNPRSNILMMLYNALHAPYMTYEGRIIYNGNLLSDVHKLTKMKGRVMANRFTALDTDRMSLSYNEIKIDTQIYIIQDNSYDEFIGENVTYYTFTTKDNEEKIIYMYTEDDDDKLVLDAKQIVEVNNNQIKYEDENDHIETVELIYGFDYVKNNRVVLNRKIDDLKIEHGKLTLIDSNKDGKYDFVKAESFETMTLKSIDAIEDKLYCDEGYIFTNPFNDSYFSEIIRVDQKTREQSVITIDELSAGDILTVYRSDDDKFLRVYAFSSTIKGVINELSDDYVKIDDTVYDLPIHAKKDEIKVGAKVQFSIDMFGNLVNIESIKESNEAEYAYFFEYNKGNGLKNAEVLLILGDKYSIYKLDSKVIVDDDKKFNGSNLDSCTALFEGGVAKRQIIKFKLNKDNKITHIYTTSGTSKNSIVKLSGITKETETKYYQWHRIYAGKYIHPAENFFLVVPTVGDEPANKDLYGTSYNFGEDVANCYVEIYDVNDDNEAGAVLIYAQNALDGMATTDGNTSVGVVADKRMGIDGPIISIWSNGKTVKYTVKDTNIPNLDAYDYGDVVRFVVAKDGRISTLFTCLDVGKTGEETPVPTLYEDGNHTHLFGRVLKNNGTYLIMVPNYQNSTFDEAMDKRFVIPTANARNCAIIDMSSGLILSASTDNIAQYIEGEGPGAYYIYTRVYKFERCFDLFVYKF